MRIYTHMYMRVCVFACFYLKRTYLQHTVEVEYVLAWKQIEDARDGRAVTGVALLIALQHHQPIGELLNVCGQRKKAIIAG